VVTDGEYPTQNNSMPISEDGEFGRGSWVFFNQASMYQASETGHETLSAARNAGHTGRTNFALDAQAAFSIR
jgi:hypothetical protein